jgi:hypothetical protein
MQSLRTYLYDSGYWNQNQPFKYDFDDSLGQKLDLEMRLVNPTNKTNLKGEKTIIKLL